MIRDYIRKVGSTVIRKKYVYYFIDHGCIPEKSSCHQDSIFKSKDTFCYLPCIKHICANGLEIYSEILKQLMSSEILFS